jgi:hypothetical protein
MNNNFMLTRSGGPFLPGGLPPPKGLLGDALIEKEKSGGGVD